MGSTAHYIKFTEFCTLLDEISTTAGVADKQSVIKTFVNYYNTTGNDLSKNSQKIDKSFFPILRLMLPSMERDRGPYNLLEHSLAKTIINVLALPPKGDLANSLYNFKHCSDKNVKDFTDAAIKILKTRFSNTSCNFTVAFVNQCLDEIAGHAGKNIRAQEESVYNLLKGLTTNGQKWLLRIILKNLKLHMGVNSILEGFHKDAIRQFACNSSLLKLCETLHDPSVNLNEIEIQLFNPFQPMLSLRCDKKEFNKSVKGNKVLLIENKFDGERFQLHYKKGIFKYYSRNGYDYSENFGKDFNQGFSSELKNAFNKNVKSVILDGEMMAWNKETKRFGSKGMNIDVKTMKMGGKYQPCFCAFDLLYLNGKVMAGTTLKQRKKLLNEMVNEIKGIMVVSKHTEGLTKQDILDSLNKSVEDKEEGIVFKDPNSVYLPGSRTNWWKMKLEFFEGLLSDLDVIVMGGYYNQGKKSIVDFLVGIIDTNFGSTKYLSFVKISNGLNEAERKTLNDKLQSNWRKINGLEHERSNMFFGKEIPDVWIKPEHSCCLLVRGSELIKAGHQSHYKAKYSLRFPRMLALRFDKPYRDCLTSTELDALTESFDIVQKLNKRPLDLADIEDEAKVKKNRKKYYTGNTEFSIKSDILKDFEFVVLSGKAGTVGTVENVEKLIKENGGKVMKAAGNSTLCMLAGDDHSRVSSYKGEKDIVKIDWLEEILNENEFSMYKSKHMLHVSAESKKKHLKLFDRFGDSYTKEAKLKDIKCIFNDVFTEEFSKNNYLIPTRKEIMELKLQLNIQDNEVFFGCRAYFDKYKIVNDCESQEISFSLFEELDFIHQGGESSDYLNKMVDFVVTNTGDANRVAELELYLRSINHESKIVKNISDIKV